MMGSEYGNYWRPHPSPEEGDVLNPKDEYVWQFISPDDGTGYWATADYYDRCYFVFADGRRTPQPEWATHIVWFNK